jgi:hypothetical protein
MRLRDGKRMPSDLDWLRAYVPGDGPAEFQYLRCDCRCRCHAPLGGAVGTDGRCGQIIDLDDLDCDRSCRAAHLLAGECDLDENREEFIPIGVLGQRA